MSYLKGTGGGPYMPPPAPQNEEEKELAQTIALSIQGLSNKNDSDGLAGTTGISLSEDDNNNDILIENVDVDWTQPHAKLLQTEIHPALRVNTSVNTEWDEECRVESTGQDYLTNDHQYHLLVDRERSSSSPGTSELNERANILSNKENEKPEKKNTSASWQSRRRPIIPSKKSNASASAKFEIVAQKKCELIGIEKEIAIEKKQHNKIEHELRVRLLKLQEEEQTMKNELLKYNLNEIKVAEHSS